MSNTFQIKRGDGAPTKEQLKPYELGYDKKNNQLYIGLEEKDPEPISAGAPKIPYTIITKTRESSGRIKPIEIRCKNLQPNTDYVIKAYTLQRDRGHSYREWRHPLNFVYNQDSGFTEEQLALLEKTGIYSGYKNIAGKPFDGKSTDKIHPSVPTWMGNGGVLRTEWHFTSDELGSDCKFDLDLNAWVLDLLKGNESAQEGFYEGADVWTLMGVGNKSYDNRSRLFQFRIETADGKTIGESKNTVKIGSAIFLVENGNISWNDSGISYVSVI